MEKKTIDKKQLARLIVTTLYISAAAFGGGFVALPMLKRKYVDDYKWFDEEELNDTVALAQSAPGTIIGNSAILIGYKMGGFLGAALAMIASIIPPLVIMTIVFYCYDAISHNPVVASLMRGLQAGVAAVFADLILKNITKVLKQKKWVPTLILISSFALAFFTPVNVFFLIIAGALVGITAVYAQSFYAKKKGKAVEEKRTGTASTRDGADAAKFSVEGDGAVAEALTAGEALDGDGRAQGVMVKPEAEGEADGKNQTETEQITSSTDGAERAAQSHSAKED